MVDNPCAIWYGCHEEVICMKDVNGNLCEYDGHVIDPSKVKLSGKTMEELQKEAKELHDRIMKAHNPG